MFKNRTFQWLALIVVVAILLILDLWLKSWATNNLQGIREHQILIPRFLGLTYHRNTGAAFGFLSGFDSGRWILTIVKIIIISGLLWFYNKIPRADNQYWCIRLPIILIIAGGLGNLVDRIMFGYVRDMLAFQFVNFPIFNLADIYVVVGCIAGIIVMLFVVKDFP